MVVANINSIVLTNKGVTIVNVRRDTCSSDDQDDRLIRVTVAMDAEISDILGENVRNMNHR